MNVEQIPLSQIEFGDRLRTVDSAWVELLAASMKERGQDTPLWVRKIGRSDKYALIAGGHRFEALRLIGKETADCTIRKVSETEAELLEIDENLIRRELTPLDRATFLARRKAVYEALHPETKAGGDRKSDQSAELCGLIPAFSEATAEKLGLSRRTVETAVQLHGLIPEDVRRQVSATWLATSGAQLMALGKLTPDMQRKVAAFAVHYPDVRNVGEITRQIEGKPAPEPAGKFEKFLAFWRKCDPEEQQQIVEHAAAQMPAVAFEAAWEKGSTYQRDAIVGFLSPHLPGAVRREAA
ncbi:ParB N-terminal domain-containing protein [Asaia sp. HN010]|uniref:ParB/RepB/Spo0J family partition protein n=1 Tax=Asaia sp. HN010 TaxID=3081233 RepID=UPI003019C601